LLHGIPMISNAFSIITRTTLKCRPRSSPHWLENVPESFGAKWQSADIGLQSIPNLRFELLAALAGVNSITVYYRGHRGLAAEVLHFSASGKVREAFAHYEEWSREDAG